MDGATFSQVYIPLRSVVATVCRQLMKSSGEADDMVQDVYLKLWEQRQALDEIQSPKAYVIRMARNRCLDRLKSAAYSRRDEGEAADWTLEQQIDNNANPHEQLVAKEQQRRLDKWVNSLKEPRKSIFILRQSEMLTNEETAQRLGLAEPTVRSTLSRLRKEARAILMEDHAL